MTSGPMIDYEALAQDAMRGVVRTVLARVAKDTALPGDHHFYISFDTQAPGVSLSKRLKEKYPNEMTIVLQHRFWDLSVSDERFEVKLTFDGIPERLVVPFTAIKVFFDPSVRYGLQFEEPDLGPEAEDTLPGRPGESKATTTRSSGPRKARTTRKPRPEKEQGAPVSTLAPAPATRPAEAAPSRPAPAPAASASSKSDAGTPDKTPEPATAGTDKAADEKPAGGAQVVSLDAFRKK